MATAHLAQEMARRHEVTVLTSQGFDLPAESIEDGVRVVRVPVFFRKQQATANLISLLTYIPMGIREGKKLLRSENYDVINTHFVLPSGPVGQALAQFSGIPNVLTVHGGDLFDPSKFTSPHRHALLRAWVRRLLRNADSVVGQSRNTLANLNSFYTPEIEGHRVPLGIQRPIEVNVSREDFGFTKDDVLLVAVGRLVARKATNQLITMMEGFRDRRVYLLLIGSGPQEPMLRQEVENHRLGDKVRFMGFVDEADKVRILRMSDLYVSTSQHEGFGLVFLEAMACGLPIVCYNYGGQTDFLEDGQTGCLVELNELDRFTEKCRQLVESPGLRENMGRINLERVEGYFIEKCAQRYETVFEEAVAGRTKEIQSGVVGRA